MATQAAGSRTTIAIVPETVFGVTPATPQTQYLEYVDFSGELNPTALSDPSRRPDRQTAFSRRGNASTEGTLDVVLAPDNYDMLLEGVTQGTWTGNELEIGTVQRSYAIEQGFEDIAQYRVFNGVVVNSMSVTITPEELVTASFGLVGTSTTAFSGTPLTAVPTPVPAKAKFYHENGTFKENGAAVAYFSQISFELTNNVTGSFALGNLGYRHVTSGRVGLTGTVEILFESTAMYDRFKNDVETDLDITLVAGAETLRFEFPRVKFTGGSITSDGDAGVTASLPFEALYDGTELTSMRITRSA